MCDMITDVIIYFQSHKVGQTIIDDFRSAEYHDLETLRRKLIVRRLKKGENEQDICLLDRNTVLTTEAKTIAQLNVAKKKGKIQIPVDLPHREHEEYVQLTRALRHQLDDLLGKWDQNGDEVHV